MLVLLLYALSGGAGLILEAVFLRQLALLLGSGALATTLVLAVFMGGLGLGAALFGRAADRAGNPLRLYGLLEIGAGLSGIALVLLFATGRPLLSAASPLLEGALAALALLVPTAFLGGTLPALACFRTREPARLVGPIGLLYGLNTLGGALGVLAAGFVLFERVGIARSGLLAGGLDVALGVAALFLARGAARPGASDLEDAVPTVARAQVVACACAAACSGAVMLGYEVVWTRLLTLALRSFSYSFSLMLALFLLGLVTGSLLIARLAPRLRDTIALLGWVQVGMGALAVSVLPWLGDLLAPPQGSSLGIALLRAAARAGWIVLPATVLSGMALPLAVRGASAGAGVGRNVGRVLALNTAGAIVGALVTGLVLLPTLGALRSLGALALLCASCGAGLLFVARGARAPAFLALAAAAACALPLFLAPGRLIDVFLGATRGRERIGEVLYFHEGATDTVAIVKKDYGFYDPGAKSLLTNGIAMSATVAPVRRYMAVEGHLPVLLAPDPRNILVIGVGTGITLGSVAAEPEPQSITAVELSEGVLGGLRYFEAEHGGVERDPRVHIVHEDGRRFLATTAQRFGAITLEPPPPIVAGSASLYSLDFYRLARKRLEPGGVVAQWLPLHAQSLPSARMTARTFLEAFPEVELFLPSIRDAVLVGSDRPLALDLKRVLRAYADPRARASLEAAYLETPEALLATRFADRAALLRWAGDVPTITDERPRMEFFRTLGANMTDREIATLLVLPAASTDALARLDPELAARVAREHAALRLYLTSEIENDGAAGLEAARRSTGTEFFRYRLGCAHAQLSFLEEALRGGSGDARALSDQKRRCRDYAFDASGR